MCREKSGNQNLRGRKKSEKERKVRVWRKLLDKGYQRGRFHIGGSFYDISARENGSWKINLGIILKKAEGKTNI